MTAQFRNIQPRLTHADIIAQADAGRLTFSEEEEARHVEEALRRFYAAESERERAEKARKRNWKNLLFWIVVGCAVLISVWAIVGLR